MDYQVSARKWRPQTFDEVVGQAHVSRTLTNAIRQGRVAHAYLFSGMRGVGKTTVARILAKTLNCQATADAPAVNPCQICASCQTITAGHSPDVIEIDGASNRGIDEVRELREVVKYAPMAGRYRIYIIDEVHMLTPPAFNALLKTLEEPPPHAVFIFATTEAHKIPATILSRCQHFHFKRITRPAMTAHLERIVREEGIRLTAPGLGVIAKAADGSLRDALSLLDQAVAYSGKEVGDQDLEVILGTAGRGWFLSMVKAILERRTAPALSLVKELTDQGLDLRQFTTELIEYFRHLVIAKSSARPEELIDLSSEEVNEIRQLSSLADVEELQRLFGIFSMALESFRGTVHPNFVLEMAVIRATRVQPLESFEKLLERLDVLEKSLPQDPADPAVAPAGPKAPSVGGSEPARSESVPLEVGEISHGPPAATDALLMEPWARVLKRLLQEKPNLGSYLEKGVVQGWVRDHDQDVLVIGYDDGSAFLGDLVQKEENRQVIASAVQEVFQKPIQLKVVRMEPSADERQRLKFAKDQKDQQHQKRIEQETRAHPLVKEALNILGGRLTDIKES